MARYMLDTDTCSYITAPARHELPLLKHGPSGSVYPDQVSADDATQPPSPDLGSPLEFESLIADLSSRFIDLPPDEVDRAVEDGLRRVCEPLGVDLSVLWQWWAATPGVIVPTHAYCAEEGLRPTDPMRQDQYPWSVEQVLAGRLIRASSVEDLPAEAAVDRETCRRFGIQSALCIPLSVGGEPPVGALGFNTLHAEREWPDPLVKRLQLVARIIATALSRRRHELGLRQARSAFRPVPSSLASPSTRWTSTSTPSSTTIASPTSAASLRTHGRA